MSTSLRLTDTNAAADSAGRTWGLEGNLVWWLIGGVGVGVTLFFLLLVGFDVALLPSTGIAVVPILLTLGYIFLLRQGKPPGYDRDLFESCFGSHGFGPDPLRFPPHPLQ